ncbi:AAA family ATPase [Sphingomicrobium sp. XHP0239]|uniref:AAA family ATPase n=1 Tax=Sphingomicrobium maritimum TaxID=3133972 RepID=UPI0031CC6E23
MREEEFRVWMKNVRRLQDSTISTQLSKLRKIDRHFGDLDELITDSRIDEVAQRLADPASLPAELGNEGERNHLRQSLRYYRAFVNDTSNSQLSDEQLLARFDSCDYFHARRKKWDEDTTKNFCRMARAAHSVGLDWYRTNIPQIRLGRFSENGVIARGTVGALHASKPTIEFNHQADSLGLDGLFRATREDAEAFEAMLEARRDAIEAWLPNNPTREGLWPAAAGKDDALIRLKRRFLKKFPDFEGSGGFPGSQQFAKEEDAYKRKLIDAAAEAVKTLSNDRRALGGRLLDLIAGDGGLESNLLGWRMANGLRDRRRDHPGLLEEAAADIALSEDPQAAVIEFVERTWEPAFASAKSNPYSDSRTIPTLVAALTHPARAIGLRTDRFTNLFLALEDERLFGWSPLTADELARATAKAEELFVIMRDEWGWQPRDLWDVQGFIWVACSTRLGEPGVLDDTPLWIVTARSGEEDGTTRFVQREEWSLLNDSGSAYNDRMRAMQVGDHIAMRHYFHQSDDLPFDANGGRVSGMRFTALGTITEVSEDGVRVGVDWEEWAEARTWYLYTNNGTVWRLSDPGENETADRLRRFLLEGEEQDIEWFLAQPYWRDRLFPSTHEKDITMKPTNLILYGPPGTGKTYRTAAEAVRLCDGDVPSGDTQEERRSALMTRYRELIDSRQIDFVTFHQSFGYEDFIEGLRPDIAEGDDGASQGFRLKAESGVFHRIAERAARRVKRSGDRLTLDGRQVFKMSLGQSNDPHSEWVFEEALEQSVLLLGFGNADWSDPRFDDQEAILEVARAGAPDEDISVRHGVVKSPDRFRNQLSIGDVVVVTKGLNAFRAIGLVEGPYEYAPRSSGKYSHRRAVRWLWSDAEGLPVGELMPDKRFSLDTIYPLPKSQLNEAALERLMNSGENDGEEGDLLPHVLIIDEINRANISKVFGELITLIEPDKRAGMANALSVTLPYSKRSFSVPANLHLIGTMNTADRSIALLDTALRRRFQFEEVAPDPSLLPEDVGGIPLRKVLETINARIEFLLDREHSIGHAFFMGDGSRDKAAIDDVIRRKVIPLLQEYFFEDFGRIHAVLGDGFIEEAALKAPPGMNDVGDRKRWSVRNSFDVDAYRKLAGLSDAASQAQLEG